MRFRLFPADSRDSSEARARARIAAGAAELWSLLAEQAALAPSVDVANARRLRAWLLPRLERLARGLRADVEAVEDAFRVAVTPADDDALDPLARTIVDCAPTTPRLVCARHRPPLPLAAVLAHVRSLTGLDLTEARARVGFSRGHLLEIVVHCSAFSSAIDEGALDAANLLVSRLLGDERFDDWVGAVDVSPLPRPSSLRVVSGAPSNGTQVSVAELEPSISVAIAGALESLPDEPYHRQGGRADWVLFDLEPGAAASRERCADLAVFSTMVPEAMRCFLEGARFSSRRFSRHGEQFVYVVVEARGLSPESKLAERARIEEALDGLLVPQAAGCVVGAGIGLEHVYVVLALLHVERGVPAAARSLLQLAPPGPAWILCCDSAWSLEWQGVGTTEAPPFLP